MRVYATDPRKPISIGFEGENNARTIVFDVKQWIEDYGNGTALLVHQRPGDAEPYPCATEQKAGIIEWAVQQADIITGGYGRAQISYKVGDNIVARSPIFKTVACASISAAETGEPGQDWINEVLDAAVQAAQSAENAEKSEESAKGWADLAQQGAANAGWFYVYGEDGILYMVRSDNAPEDFGLEDNGKGVLIAVYG